MTDELSFSDCSGHSGVGEAFVDVMFDGAECSAELGWSLGLAGREERAQDPVVDLGAEDGESQAVGVRS